MRYRAPFIALSFLLLRLPTTPTRAAGISWTLSFADEFTGTQIDQSSWSVYGKNGPKGPDCFDDENITVGGGMATLALLPSSECQGFSAAGMCGCPVATQTYGKFEVRMKATVGNSKIALLLYGAQQWPPEVDFAEFPGEGDGMLRQRFFQTLHYSSENLMIHSSTVADMTQWHTVGVEWSPGLLVYTLDGAPVTTLTEHVPTVPMWLGISNNGRSDSTPAYTYLDWVHVYTYDGGGGASDTFTRTVSNGWGTADQGGAWVTKGGSTSDYAVNGSSGTMKLTTANVARLAYLPEPWADTDFLFRVSFDRKPVGSMRVIGYGIARYAVSSGAFYAVRVSLVWDGTIRLDATKKPSVGIEAPMGPEANLGNIGAANTWYWVRGHVGAEGANVRIQGRVWKDGDPEPSVWQYSYLDTSSLITAAGMPGLRAASWATDTPYTVSFDDYSASGT